MACATGALGAALAHMVVSYSLGKKSLAEHQPALEHAARALTTARAVLLELAEEDAEAYAAVNALLKLPDPDPRRARELPAAAERAVQVPMAAIATCVSLARLCEQLCPMTNRHLASDLAIAALLADAGARAAEWNVRVNLTLLAEPARREAVRAESGKMLADAAAAANATQRACGA